MRRGPALLPTVLAVAATVSCSAAVSAAPPPPPDAEEARAQLAELTVVAEGSGSGYDREKFPHWSDQGESCNTREVVLRRDGENVTVGSDCYPTSGSWTSPYDGATWRQPSDIDTDHMVRSPRRGAPGRRAGRPPAARRSRRPGKLAACGR